MGFKSFVKKTICYAVIGTGLASGGVYMGFNSAVDMANRDYGAGIPNPTIKTIYAETLSRSKKDANNIYDASKSAVEDLTKKVKEIGNENTIDTKVE